MDNSYDLSVLTAELTRHGLPPLGADVGPVLDPLTVDRAVDPYRKGSRTLQAACQEYGVPLDGAHEAGVDALAAVRVACALAERHPRIAAAEPWDLHRRQVDWYAEWAEGYQRWLRRRDRDAVVDDRWPLRADQHGDRAHQNGSRAH